MKCAILFSVCLCLAATSQAQFTQPTLTYLMHSSGLHIKRASDGIAKLESRTVATPQQVTFVPVGGDYYVVRADNNKSYMALSGEWETHFVADSTLDNAQWKIERQDDFFVKLRCKANGKYLGTDANTADAWVFANKDGTSPLHHWFFSDNPKAEVPVQTVNYRVNPTELHQRFDGWGVSLCWWANMCGRWDDAKINTLVDWLVSPTGLNYSHFRYNIGGGDDPAWSHCEQHHMAGGMGLRAEMPGFKDFSGDSYHWERDEAQRKLMLKIREKRPDAIFEVFSNSAPYYMTYSGCVSGNTDPAKDNLRPEYYEEFAHYLVDVCQHYKDEYGIEFRTLEPFNEAMTDFWRAGGTQEGCHFDVQSQINFLRVLAPVLKASGLNTVISASDETKVAQSVADFNAYKRQGVLPLIGQWNTHTYSVTNADRKRLRALADEAGIPLWMSEVGAGGSGLGGNLALAQKLFDDMRYLQPEAWIDWQVMEEDNDQWCTVTGSFANQTFSRNKNYYVRGQTSRFIRRGYRIVGSGSDQSLAAINATGDTLVLVVLNEGTKAIHQVDLSLFADMPAKSRIVAYRTSATENLRRVSDFALSEHQLTITLPTQSITTLVLPIRAKSDDTRQQTLRNDISLSDPFILADAESKRYYMTGTNGELYQSSDLELWTGPEKVINVEGKAWFGAAPEVWAPEIHHVDGRYYYIATFTNNNVQVDEQGHPRRAVHLLQSSLPDGVYTLVPASESTYLPSEKTTLDGSLFTDTDGQRYLIYCHEWIQNGNGTIEYLPLKENMTAAEGEATVMTRAGDASWNDSPVTDGPFLFRTQTGRLGMIWTSWHGGRYVQGVAYSTTGSLDGPWKHEPLPITPDNYGHGMLFRTFEGQLLMSIHSHRTIDASRQWWERQPMLFVMDDSGDRLRTVMEYRRDVGPANPARVMVDNPEFEYGKQGWGCTTGAQNQLIAHNQSGAITGNFFESWDGNSFTGEIYQEKTVPNGTYQLTAAAFRSQLIAGGRDDAEAVWLFAGDEQTLVSSTTPQYYSVIVHVTDGRLRFGLRSTKKNFRWMGIDNVTLNYYGESELTADEIDQAARNAAVYLRNRRDGRFLGAGRSWGTQAILTSHPLDLRLTALPDGRYAIDSRIDNGGGNHYVGTNGYMDSPLSPFFVNFIDEHTVTLSPDGSHYWGNSGTSTVNTTMTNPDNEGVQWDYLTYDELLAELSEATTSSPSDATFLIECPDFGRNDTRVSAWQGDQLTVGGDVTNQCAQAPTGEFDIYQHVTGIPNGVYQLSVQGFCRHASAKLYAGANEVPLKDIASEQGIKPSSLETASEIFTAAKYSNDLSVEVTDGTLRLGIRQDNAATASDTWIVFDNFELRYMGPEPTAVTVTTASHKKDDVIYDLSGRMIPQPSRHKVFITNGRKMMSVGNNASLHPGTK